MASIRLRFYCTPVSNGLSVFYGSTFSEQSVRKSQLLPSRDVIVLLGRDKWFFFFSIVSHCGPRGLSHAPRLVGQASHPEESHVYMYIQRATWFSIPRGCNGSVRPANIPGCSESWHRHRRNFIVSHAPLTPDLYITRFRALVGPFFLHPHSRFPIHDFQSHVVPPENSLLYDTLRENFSSSNHLTLRHGNYPPARNM